MFRHFAKEESGMTMVLAIMTMVIIGVMGAGLLTFVVGDLNSVVQSNQGQKAFNIADAGVQAAKNQLRLDSFRQHYDMSSNDCTVGTRVGDPADNWSPATNVWTNNVNCTGPTTRSSSNVGVTKTFPTFPSGAGGKFQVTIQCFHQVGDATGAKDPCSGISQLPPEVNAVASDKKFFKVTSTSYYGNAIRKIQAIYYTSKTIAVPIAYFSARNINFNGGPALSKLSFFAGRNITGVFSGSFSADRTTPALYGDWVAPPYNTTQRKTPSGVAAQGVGFGAVGLVCQSASHCSTSSDSAADGYYDYDSSTGTKGQRKKFVYKTDASGNPAPTRALTPSEISFPFDPGTAISNPSTLLGSTTVSELQQAAVKQGNYINTSSGTYYVTSWSEPGSVLFVDGRDVDYKYNSTAAPKGNGVIVVRNGNFIMDDASNGFQGIVIVIGNGTTTGTYTNTGNTPLDGFVVSSGDQNLGGGVTPSTSTDYSNLSLSTI